MVLNFVELRTEMHRNIFLLQDNLDTTSGTILFSGVKRFILQCNYHLSFAGNTNSMFLITLRRIQVSGKVKCVYSLVAVGSSGILKGKQKLGVTFNSDKLGGIDFTNISKLTMCSA